MSFGEYKPAFITFLNGVQTITIQNTRDDLVSLDINLLHTGDLTTEIQFSDRIQSIVYLPEISMATITGTSEDVNLDSITVERFPLIVGYPQQHYNYVFNEEENVHYYIYEGLDYTDWRAETLIENPEDHRLYPLKRILQPTDGLEPIEYNSDSLEIIIPKTVRKIESYAIDCTGISKVDMRFCRELPYSMNYFKNIPWNMVIAIPGHWIYDIPDLALDDNELYSISGTHISISNIPNYQKINDYIEIRYQCIILKEHCDGPIIINTGSFNDITTKTMNNIKSIYFADGNYYLDVETLKSISDLNIYVRDETIKIQLQEQYDMTGIDQPEIETVVELIQNFEQLIEQIDVIKNKINAVISDNNKIEETALPDKVVSLNDSGKIDSDLLLNSLGETFSERIKTLNDNSDDYHLFSNSSIYIGSNIVQVAPPGGDDGNTEEPTGESGE